jgi:Zn-dependent protease with chaperone function
MKLAVYLPLVLPLLAAVSARRLAEWLPPRTATWLLTGSAVILAAASTAVLGLLALAAILRIPLVAAVGDLSLHAISRHDHSSLPLGLAAAALLAAAAAAVARAAWLRTSALVAAHQEARWLPGRRQVVVVSDAAVDAYAAPGWPGRIVITTGMMRALTEDERQVLLDHERAHACGYHYLFTAAARLAAAANPLLRPLAAAVGYSVERWADEEAAAAAGNRKLAARAIATAALAAQAGHSGQAVPAGALGAVADAARVRGAGAVPRRVADAARVRGAGAVPRRVAALLRPPPQPRLLLAAVAVALVAVSGLSVLDAARSLHGLIEFAQAAGFS